MEDEDESTCRKPCDPDAGCEEGADYWQRMVTEGFWDWLKHRWTNKGWREMLK